MTFHRIDLMPSFDRQRAQKVKERWENDESRALHENIWCGKARARTFFSGILNRGGLGFLRTIGT